MKRLFFALWPGDDVRKRIVKLNQSIQSTNLVKVRPDNIHVTLVYLGNVNAESEILIRQSVDEISIKPFVLHFDQIAYWRKPKVLCLTTQQYDSQLSLLVDGIKKRVEQYGIKTEDRPYKPHITLARKANKAIDMNDISLDWSAQSFCLLESCSTTEGVKYHVLQSWDFE